MARQHQFFLTVPRRLEALVMRECEACGAETVKETHAGVHATGDLAFAYRVCMWSRVATTVRLVLGRGPARDGDVLYRSAKRIDWSVHFDVNQTFAVSCTLGRTTMDHNQYAMLRVKDAIVDQFRTNTTQRPSVDRDRPDVRIHVHIDSDEATFYLDLSGHSLHQRGYRRDTVEAPLKENVAAAILLRAGWPAIAAAGGSLVDPMCGSGTFAIEAAMIAGDQAPGLRRGHFGFLGWKHHQPEIWDEIVEDARQRAEVGQDNIPTIVARDVSPMAVRASRANAARAGFEFLDIGRGDVRDIRPPVGPPGLLVCNPPYGERVGQGGVAEVLHEALGEVMQEHFMGWKAAILTLNRELGFALGLRAIKQKSLDNGKLDCLLLHFDVAPERVYRS